MSLFWSITSARRRSPSDTRYSLSALSGLQAHWDASRPGVAVSGSPQLINALPDLSPLARSLASIGTGTDRVTLLPGPPSSFSTSVGGSNNPRFEPPTGTADNLFATGGMIVAALKPDVTTGGFVMAKWNTSGWLLQSPANGTMRLECYTDGNQFVYHTFTIPAASWMVVEIEYSTASPNTAPTVRINGVGATVTTAGGAGVIPTDAAAQLCVGNLNWAGMNDPWRGEIGEIALFSTVPTTLQKDSIRSDWMSFWSANTTANAVTNGGVTVTNGGTTVTSAP